MVGTVLVLCGVVAGWIIVSDPFSGRRSDQISIAIDTPYVGQGVRAGTALVMHGVQVGVVKAKTTLPSGGVRLVTDLQRGPIAGLTDTMKIDFRPINYFGVTGVNIVASRGGHELHDGMRVTTVPQANSTLQALLNRLGQVSTAALTPKLISVIDRAVQYTDGLNPLVETLLIVTHTVADVQTVPTARLLTNATGVGVAFPSFTDAVVGTIFNIIDKPRRFPADVWKSGPQEYIRFGSTDFFGGASRILVNYIDDLMPVIDSVKLLSDPVPNLFRPDDFANTLVQLRTRYEKLFAGNGEQRALQVKIVLDSLPGVQAPLGAMGGPQ
ncbi:Mammalian cell entry related domain protein [Mycobacterium palustre]|uniref:Mammalian cell entry related domain protein n=1 Tax=Mycobacterium palustre TaxID=153971 RepID=UPI001FE93A04|nr:Mammalian cell entry related domain protein [Mycobacterium palustre]